MKPSLRLTVAALTALTCTNAFSMQTIFYFLRYKTPDMQPVMQKEMASLRDHSKRINAVITQAYQINKVGEVTGYTNDDMTAFTRTNHINTYILVTNNGFRKEDTHLFLHNTKAQEKAIQALGKLCNENHFQGVQMDFENIDIQDKKPLTDFYVNLARAIHQLHLTVSFAVVPAVTEGKQASNYQQRKFDHWSGAYDLAALSKVADFISLMTYDQHIDGTTPGPNAAYRWVEAALQNTLKYVPAAKLSLGIPTYSVRWYVGGHEHLSVKTSQISYKAAQEVLKENQASLQWNAKDKFHYSIYDHNWLYQYLYLEDAASFKARYALAKKYKLHGVSVFNLGNEDPLVWKNL